MRATRVALLLVAAAITALGAAPAASAKAKSKTKVLVSSFNFDDPSFFIGEVTSKQKSCRKGRKVTLYRATAGKDERVGSAKTISGEGTWAWIIEAPGALSGDVYYARAGETKSCQADRSPNYTI